jgi:predicted nuclease of predicted toxin-antitoxin system
MKAWMSPSPRGFQRRGVEAFSARDRDKLGLADEEQLNFAREEKATILTHDTDFLRIAAHWIDEGRTHCGVIYCHQTAYGIGDCIRNLKILVTVLSAEDMLNHIEFL